QWQRLLEDMEYVSNENKPYFLGSVILKQQPTQTGSGTGDKRTVIDGQQRLTTLNIFFKVLCLKTNQDSRFERVFKLINNDIALWHNHNDIKAFNKILDLKVLEDISGDDNVTSAYSYFKEHLNPDKLDFNKILSNVLFVGIDLDEREDEQQIFDTINSLGVKLTTAELLKNYFFNREEEDLYKKYWENIFETDDETKKYWDKEITTGRIRRTFIDLFFWAYLQIKIQEPSLKVKTEDKIEFSKVETLFDSYKNFIKNYSVDKKDILEEIKIYAELFGKNFNYEIIEQELTADFGIERINAIIFGLETSTLIPYVLYVLKNTQNSQVQQNELFEVLESYLMRRMVIRADTKNYNQLFTDRLIQNEILSKQKFIDFFESQEGLINSFPNNNKLKEGFDEATLINKQSAGILYFIESKLRNERDSTRLLGISKYSLEHLMPKKWENNWGKINDKEKRDFRNWKLLTLGNLAIITQSLNSSIRDANWKTKKKGKDKKGGLKLYSSGIKTLIPYLELEQWNEEEIQKRANFLYEEALKIWKK
ncbi:MAG: DUF262 domain-containing HNH endonuclease family protein, partial [Capnocytophaga sp.]|nr:DUF262 domain-containing HNH endonuclease family protein [Capnocytophaga sp.]